MVNIPTHVWLKLRTNYAFSTFLPLEEDLQPLLHFACSELILTSSHNLFTLMLLDYLETLDVVHMCDSSTH